MNPHALDVLGYRDALAIVGGFASSPLGAGAVAALGPSIDPGEIREELATVERVT